MKVISSHSGVLLSSIVKPVLMDATIEQVEAGVYVCYPDANIWLTAVKPIQLDNGILDSDASKADVQPGQRFRLLQSNVDEFEWEVEDVIRDAIWFSPKRPTVEEVANIKSMRYQLIAVQEGRDLAKEEIGDDEARTHVMSELVTLAMQAGAHAIFGSFPAPVLADLYESRTDKGNNVIPCFSAWGTKGMMRRGKLIRGHVRFVQVGTLTTV